MRAQFASQLIRARLRAINQLLNRNTRHTAASVLVCLASHSSKGVQNKVTRKIARVTRSRHVHAEVRPGDLVGRDPASTGAGSSAPVVPAPRTAAGPLISRASHHAFAPDRLGRRALGMLLQLNLLFVQGRMVTPSALEPAYQTSVHLLVQWEQPNRPIPLAVSTAPP